MHIHIEPYAKPVHARPYLVPSVHLSVFKKELGCLVKLGVLVPQHKANGPCQPLLSLMIGGVLVKMPPQIPPIFMKLGDLVGIAFIKMHLIFHVKILNEYITLCNLLEIFILTSD